LNRNRQVAGESDAGYVPVESEHSAMSACFGASAVGARTFTATAGQGLELMYEALYVASAMRLLLVMAVANRALSAPINICDDRSDATAVRDTRWIQIFAESGQDVVDNVLCAFRIAEDHRVLLPDYFRQTVSSQRGICCLRSSSLHRLR